mmetsp:Transcript_16551/g.24328  ORF Transcript_16551/g.24328 Transcript_16551/m.24328 type:complete len:288 (+) Transcript_16551:581-1444(+)
MINSNRKRTRKDREESVIEDTPASKTRKVDDNDEMMDQEEDEVSNEEMTDYQPKEENNKSIAPYAGDNNKSAPSNSSIVAAVTPMNHPEENTYATPSPSLSMRLLFTPAATTLPSFTTAEQNPTNHNDDAAKEEEPVVQISNNEHQQADKIYPLDSKQEFSPCYDNDKEQYESTPQTSSSSSFVTKYLACNNVLLLLCNLFLASLLVHLQFTSYTQSLYWSEYQHFCRTELERLGETAVPVSNDDDLEMVMTSKQEVKLLQEDKERMKEEFQVALTDLEMLLLGTEV